MTIPISLKLKVTQIFTEIIEFHLAAQHCKRAQNTIIAFVFIFHRLGGESLTKKAHYTFLSSKILYKVVMHSKVQKELTPISSAPQCVRVSVRQYTYIDYRWVKKNCFHFVDFLRLSLALL